MKIGTLPFLVLFLFFTYSGISQVKPTPDSHQISAKLIGQEDKMLHISANLVVTTPEELFVYIDDAKAAGANTVLFADTKLNTYGLTGTSGARWDERIRILVDGIKERGMKLHFITISMGFASSLIASNPNLTTGYPIRGQELKATNGELVPIKSATILNGGFENFEGNKVLNWQFQDAEGVRTFVDTDVKRSGRASFKAIATGNDDSRIFTVFDAKPFHQYTLRFWIKSENLTARNLAALVRDENNKERTLTNLHISLPKDNGGRVYYNGSNKLTTDGWEEVRIAFNSLNATKINLALAIYGGVEGTLWWDDVEIIDTPTLNWIDRDDLPITINRSNGQPLALGSEVIVPADSKLGISGFAGAFDTQHLGPKIRVNENASIQEGAIFKLNGYHALPTASGQISASWNHPEVFRRMRTIHEKLYTDFRPDAFLLNYSEIRTGGWEPSDTILGTSGAALATSIERTFNDLFEVAPDVDYYFWSDMIDPQHNAIADYYQVNNTLDKSWVTVNPDKVTLATWWEGQKINDRGTKSLKFFSDLGFKQILGAYYDEEVTTNFNRWTSASQGVKNITGSIYATWVTPKDFSKIARFGELWWSETGANNITGHGWRLENNATKKWIRTKDCDTTIDETTPLVLTSTLNTGDCTVFEFIPTDDGYYFIQNKATNGRYRPKDCRTVFDDSVAIVQVGEGSFGWCEQWALIPTDEEGYFRIQNRQTEGWIRSQGCSNIIDESVSITQVSQDYTGACTKWKLVSETNSTTTAEKVDDEKLTLFPNPANDRVSIAPQASTKNASSIAKVTIYDIQGRKHKSLTAKMLTTNQNSVNVADLSNGLYILQIVYENQKIQNKKFVVRH